MCNAYDEPIMIVEYFIALNVINSLVTPWHYGELCTHQPLLATNHCNTVVNFVDSATSHRSLPHRNGNHLWSMIISRRLQMNRNIHEMFCMLVTFIRIYPISFHNETWISQNHIAFYSYYFRTLSRSLFFIIQ